MSNRNIISFDNLSLQEFDTETDLIPLLTPEDEEEMNNEELPNSLPILPLRNTVLFPGVVIPISAGRDKSIKLINDANAGNKIIGYTYVLSDNLGRQLEIGTFKELKSFIF
jgi:ATP-dependent Lon protease